MKIESSVPAPANNSDIFKAMEVGDSVLIHQGNQNSKEYNRGKQYFKRAGKKMVSRTEEGGLRIWRIA